MCAFVTIPNKYVRTLVTLITRLVCVNFWLADKSRPLIICFSVLFDMYEALKQNWNKTISMKQRASFVSVLLFASNVFEANHANILWTERTAFTRSAIIPPKVNRFGWNLEQCEPNVGGVALADFERDSRSSDSLRVSRNFVYLSGK